MTIAEAREKCKSLLVRVPRDVLILSVLLFASSASFGFGYFAGLETGKGTGSTSSLQVSVSTEDSPIATDFSTAAPTPTRVGAPTETSGFVASKNGMKYYLPECAGADRISDANKVWFVSSLAAVAAGYAPAVNCKGL